jgi:hypothetical protein
VVVILRVTVGSGVKVAVGGNQTMVAVGVWLGCGAVLVGTVINDADAGRHAVRLARQKIVRPAKNIQRIPLVYYGRSFLGKYRHVKNIAIQK